MSTRTQESVRLFTYANSPFGALHFRVIIDKQEGPTTKRNARRMANVILPTTDSMPSWLKEAVIHIWHIMLRNAGFVKRAAHMLDPKKDVKTLHAEGLQGFEDRIRETGFLAGTEEPSFADIAAFAEIGMRCYLLGTQAVDTPTKCFVRRSTKPSTTRR